MRETLRRFEGAGLGWPLPDGMSDSDLEAALYANHGTKRGHRRHAEPDWPTVHRELKRKHVTLMIVWDEYIAANPGGYSYSRFCELYRGFESKLSPTMRQTHAAGERLFVDYAGDGVPVVIDRLTGEIRKAQIFVAVLGASSFTIDPMLTLVALTFAAVGTFCTFGVFWTLPTAWLSGTTAAGAIALINSIGNLAGFGGPYLVGWVKETTGSGSAGLLVLAVLPLIAGILVFIGNHRTATEFASVPFKG